ncbi:unnamed protein product [Closterium sp. NIES-54]
MASLNVLTFDAEGRAVDFEVWLDDLQLFLQCDSKDGLSLFDLTSGASTAKTADADCTVCSQWLTRDAAARLAVRNHLPSIERAHFSQYKSVRALYDVVVARYSSPTTAALSRLMLPYLFPDLAAFSTVTDLVTHLRTSDACYRAALPTAFLPTNSPPMYITLYYLVTRLPDSLSSVRDHFLSLCPTELTVDLLEERLVAAEKSILAVGASRGDRRTPFFEGCSPVPLLPSVASAAAVDLVGTEEVGAASAPSGRRRTGKGKGSKGGGGGGGGSGGGGGGSGGGGPGVYGLRQVPREWHNTFRTTLAALGYAPSTADPSLFLRTDTTLPPFYVLVYVDGLVFATADTGALAHVKSELQKRHTCTDLGELTSYLGLRITRDRAQRTITLTQSSGSCICSCILPPSHHSHASLSLPSRHLPRIGSRRSQQDLHNTVSAPWTASGI